MKGEFGEKHNYTNSMQANVEYIGYAKANKLNPGWSKSIIQVLRQNNQIELADRLQPSLFILSVN